MAEPVPTSSRRRGPAEALFAIATLAGGGTLTGYLADDTWITALILQAEPFLLVALLLCAYLVAVVGRRALALGLALGGMLAFIAIRLPWPASETLPALATVPEWFSPVLSCGGAVKSPDDDVRILQWRVGTVADVAEVEELAERLRPDILVLFGVDSADLVSRVHADLGGEYHFDERTDDDPSVLVLTRGVFYLCEADEEWRRPGGLFTFAFVAITPDTTLPLLVVRYPGPTETTHLSRRLANASEGDAWLLGAFGWPATVVLGDVPAPTTWRHLDNRMATAGFRPLLVPPTWPAHLGNLPFLPLHPFDRAWAGAAWRVAEAVRVPLPSGGRAPLLLTLQPASRTAGR